MKLKTTKLMKRLLLTLVVMCCCVFASHAVDHVTMTLTNCAVTSNTITYDVMVVNDGTGTVAFNSTTTRITFSAAIVPATVVPSYVAGSSDFPAAFPTPQGTAYSITYSSGTRLVTLTTSTGNYTSGTALQLPPNVPRRIGTFTLTNSANWAAGQNVGLTWSGTTTGIVSYNNGAGTTTGMNTTTNRTLGTTCTLVTPSVCSSPPTANAGGPYSSCGNKQLSGSVGGSATAGTWSTPNGTGSFSPSHLRDPATHIPISAGVYTIACEKFTTADSDALPGSFPSSYLKWACLCLSPYVAYKKPSASFDMNNVHSVRLDWAGQKQAGQPRF